MAGKTGQSGEELGKEKLDEKIGLVLAHRMEDLAMRVPVGAVVKCRYCKEKCIVTSATVQTIADLGYKHYQVVCSRCAPKHPELNLKYYPFSRGQMKELGNMTGKSLATHKRGS